MSAFETALRIRSLVKEHHSWRSRVLPLMCSENVMSPLARELMGCDFQGRYANSHGDLLPHFFFGNKYMEKVDQIAVDLVKKLFNAKEVELHLPSGKLGCEAVALALTERNDLVLELYPIVSGLRRIGLTAPSLRLDYLPYNKREVNIDSDDAVRLIRKKKPRLIMLGDTDILFPHPIKAISEAADDVSATVVYDASHVYALIAGKRFQDPFGEGASVIDGTTHKTVPGPQGGLILMKEADETSEKIISTVHTLIGNHHPNRKAVLAVVFAEMLAFGEQYASAIIRNAKALGQALYERGFDVLCPDKGFTQSHQILISNKISNIAPEPGGAREVGGLLDKANIITDVSFLPYREWSTRGPPVLRFGTPELARIGMGPSEMDEIASICERLVLKREKPSQIAEEVADLMDGFQKLQFCFDEAAEAYEYFDMSRISNANFH